MLENHRSWHKFRDLLGYLPARRRGLVLLADERKVLWGAISQKSDDKVSIGFRDRNLPAEDLDSAWEDLSKKYNAVGATFVQRKELMALLGQLAAPKPSKPAFENYHVQIGQIREALKISSGDKNTLGIHKGDRPVAAFWPGELFLLKIFQSFFAELLPERKILLLGVIDGPNSLNSLVVEFRGSALKSFQEPDWAGFDWQAQSTDFFEPSTAARFVLWCENRYMLPTYGLFVTRAVWDECQKIQKESGERAAWKYFLSRKNMRDADPEIRLDPEPWPLRATIHWHSMRG